MKVSLPETNSSHLKMDGWNTIVSYLPGKKPIFHKENMLVLGRCDCCLFVVGRGRWYEVMFGWEISTSQTAESFRCVHGQNGRVDVSGLASCQESGTGGWWWNHRCFFPWFFWTRMMVKSIQLKVVVLNICSFHPLLEEDSPFWLICFNWVESTNYSR